MDDLLALSSSILDAADAGDDTNHIVNRITNQLSEVADGLAMVESFSHSVVVDAGDELVAFDASHANTGSAVVDAIEGWSAKPVRHLVFTHGHADHVGGSPSFAARYGDVAVHGHEAIASRFERYRMTNGWNLAINARQFGGVRADFPMGEDQPEFIPADTLEPTELVADHAAFTVGDRTFELHHARGETDDHLWGWMPDERWLFVGDFVTWVFPNAGNPQKVQRYPLEWAAALREMAAREPEVMLPAHGLPIGGTDRIVDVLTTIADTLERL
ncbi:MAG: MBL fold metallo-hydrolase, partial [Actinomycetota bacterium]